MKYKYKLQIFIIPLIILAISVVSLIFVLNTKTSIRNLQFEIMDYKVKTIINNCNKEQSLLERVGMDKTDFYLNGAKRKVIQTIESIQLHGGFFFIFDSTGVIVYHQEIKDPPEDFTYLNIKYVSEIIYQKKGKININKNIDDKKIGAYIAFFDYFKKWDWFIVAAVNKNTIFRPLYQSSNMAFLTALITISGAILVLYFIAMSISKPIDILKNYSVKMGKGDFDLDMEINTKDEFENLAIFFKQMADKIKIQTRDMEKIKSYLTNILESMPSVIIAIDDCSIISQWNQAAVYHFDLSATDAIGKYLWETVPSLERYKNYCQKVIRDAIPFEFHREKLSSDEHSYFNISLFPLIDNGVTGVVIRIDDISELEKREQELRQAQKMETVGNLAGGLAHDFNNVLGGIIGTVSIMKLKLMTQRSLDWELCSKYLDIIEKSSTRATKMVQHLLSLSRKQELSFKPVDLNNVISHIIEICRNTFDKSIEIQTEYNPEKVIVNADHSQLEQVFLNFCVNASHAMTMMRSDGAKWGGKLTLSIEKIVTDKDFYAIHPESEKIDYWKTVIQDTGVGMDTRTIAKIFDPFFTTKEKGKGTGLGLAMVYNIVKLHKGFIDVFSEPGLGTIFHVYLPIFKTQINNINAASRRYPRGRGLILVVDDEETMRSVASEMLTECGYHVIYACDGDDAIEVFKKRVNDIQAILLDMVMPKKSGKETYIELKKIKPDIKVLLASGFRQDERVEAVLRLGINGFIQKPFTIEELARAIFKVIDE